MFTRPYPDNYGSNYYYYQAIQVTVHTGGTYSFTSSSSIDTYGCFYDDSFDPSNPSRNLITCNDDSAGSRQFQIKVTLQSGRSYVLVVTTFYSADTGSFSIRGAGPASVGLPSIMPTSE
jgi:hypothetical protein